MSQNHLIDPTYFYDVIEQFAFDYVWYARSSEKIDDLGRVYGTFDKQTIRGSLQPSDSKKQFSVSGVVGNTTSLTYDFYCKSLYRIYIGDFIYYKGKYLYVDGVHDYDEWGVRTCSLTMTDLNEHRDFQEYLNYLEGAKSV